MKFQNPSFKFFLNGRTNERTSRKQYAPHFFKVGGIIMSRINQNQIIIVRHQGLSLRAIWAKYSP